MVNSFGFDFLVRALEGEDNFILSSRSVGTEYIFFEGFGELSLDSGICLAFARDSLAFARISVAFAREFVAFARDSLAFAWHLLEDSLAFATKFLAFAAPPARPALALASLTFLACSMVSESYLE